MSMKITPPMMCVCALVLMVPMFIITALMSVRQGVEGGNIGLGAAVTNIIIIGVSMVVVVLILATCVLKRGPLSGLR